MQIYSDGSALENGNPSSKGANGFIVIQHEELVYKFTELDKNTTSNQQELKGLINALKYCKENYLFHVDIFTDSQYCSEGVNTWSIKWKKNNWKKSINSKKNIKNVDLWIELDFLVQEMKPDIKWVKGHQTKGNSIEGDYNRLIDQLITQSYSLNL